MERAYNPLSVKRERLLLTPAEELLRTSILARLGRRPYRTLAKAIGLSEQMVGEMLNGHRGIRMAHLGAIAEFFHVEVKDLFVAPSGKGPELVADNPDVIGDNPPRSLTNASDVRHAAVSAQKQYREALILVRDEIHQLCAAESIPPCPPTEGVARAKSGTPHTRRRSDRAIAVGGKSPSHPKRRAG